MTTVAEYTARIGKAVVNMIRFDRIVNGGIDEVVGIDGGQTVRSLRGIEQYGNKGDKGDPGGNVMSVGPASTLSTLNIPNGTTTIRVSGPGGGFLDEDTTMTDANVTAHPKAIYKTNNGRYFRRDPRDIWIEMFEADATGVGDSSPALRGALAYTAFSGVTDSGYPSQRFGYAVNCGVGRFRMASRFNLTFTGKIIGSGGGHELGASGTLFLIEETGFIVERADTYNFGAAPAGQKGADGFEFYGLLMRYAGPATTPGYGKAFGITSHARMELHNCGFEGFPGPAWQILATSQNPVTNITVQGEASGCVISKCYSLANFVGGYVFGGDANLESITDCTFGGNLTWGLRMAQFLSCTITNCHFKQNGETDPVFGASMVNYMGSRYQTVPGGTWSNPPTDTTAWSFLGEAVAYLANWTSGGKYKEGGSVYHDNVNARSVFIGCYHEDGSGLPFIQSPAMSVGGQWGHATSSSGVHITSEQGALGARMINVVSRGASTQVVLSGDGLSAYNPVSGSQLYIGSRARGIRIGLGQADVDTAVYFDGAGDAHPGYARLLKTLLPGPFADNAAALAAGLVPNQLFMAVDGTARGVLP